MVFALQLRESLDERHGQLEQDFAAGDNLRTILTRYLLAVDLDFKDLDGGGIGWWRDWIVAVDQLVDEFDLPLFAKVASVEVDFGLHVPEFDQT